MKFPEITPRITGDGTEVVQLYATLLEWDEDAAMKLRRELINFEPIDLAKRAEAAKIALSGAVSEHRQRQIEQLEALFAL
ncbi:MAG TPA: hypothetical protein VK534_01970 [Methylomirabilota bacterium]|nr:hypothetical protein [Methylomirabilota bacterium]